MHWRNGHWCRFVAVVLALVLMLPVLAACGGGGEEEETFTSSPTSTATITPTQTTAPTVAPIPTTIPTATPTPTSAGPVKIGVVHDWTGAWAISGMYYADRLIKLVDKQVKDMGGILGGRDVKFLKYDGASTLAGIISGATKAVTQDHVSAIILGGTASVNGEALSKYAEENKTLYVNLFILPQDISNLKYTIRPGYRLDEMMIFAEYATKVLGAKTAGILCRDFAETRWYGAEWRKIMEAAGGKIVYEDYYTLGVSDFSSYLTKIKYANPDVLFTDMPQGDYVNIASQMQGLGGWGKTKVFLQMAGVFAVGRPGTEGWYVYARWLPGLLDNPGSKKFIQDYKAMFNTEPDAIFCLMYDPFWWAIKAIELAGTDEPEAVARAARSGNLTWESPEGLQQIGTDGEPTPKFRLLAEVQGGKMVPVQLPE